jgi:hypothetical protein
VYRPTVVHRRDGARQERREGGEAQRRDVEQRHAHGVGRVALVVVVPLGRYKSFFFLATK